MLDQGIDWLEQLARLDPRSPDGAISLDAAYGRLGRYGDADDTALARALSLRPSSMAIPHMRAMLAAAQGDLSGVRQQLRALQSSAGRRRVMAYVALREILIFALDDEQQRCFWVLRLPTSTAGRPTGHSPSPRCRGCVTIGRRRGPTVGRRPTRTRNCWRPGAIVRSRAGDDVTRSASPMPAVPPRLSPKPSARSCWSASSTSRTHICLSFLPVSMFWRTDPSWRSTSSKKYCGAKTSIHARGCQSIRPLRRSERICGSSDCCRAPRLSPGPARNELP
jgi:hypothetical protein